MAAEFQGRVELDIRDSEPDWGPFAAPTAPRRCAQRALPGVGRHRHRDLGLLRRTGRHADHEPDRRARGAAVPVPHHRAVLPDPGVAADRTQRHHGRNGHHRGVHRRVPQLQRPDPARDRAALGGARRARLEHLLRRQVASDAARGVQSCCHQTALAAGVAASSGSTASWAARPTSGIPSWCTTTTRWHRRPPRRRATTCRRTSPTRRSSSSATPR